MKKIVVVSNSPALVGCGLGEYIDSFDEVVRFNKFAIKGHEQDVGTRTTIHSCFYRTRVENLPEGCRRLSLDYRKDRRKAKKVADCEIIPYRINKSLLKQIGQTKGSWVSSGLMVMAYLLEEVDMLWAAGFYCSTVQRDFGRHYENADRKSKAPKAHHPELEIKAYQKWITEGRIVELTTRKRND